MILGELFLTACCQEEVTRLRVFKHLQSSLRNDTICFVPFCLMAPDTQTLCLPSSIRSEPTRLHLRLPRSSCTFLSPFHGFAPLSVKLCTGKTVFGMLFVIETDG